MVLLELVSFSGPDTPYVTALTPVAAVDVFTPPTPTAPTTLTLGEADVHFASNKADLTDPAAAEQRLTRGGLARR